MPENGTPPNRIYRFGEYCLSADDRMLLRGKERVDVSPRVMSLLLVLVENAGRLVSKETLMGRVWSDSFVEEGNLNRTVSRLRKVLGEKPDENRFIETVPRVGYRFVADVELLTEGTPAATAANAAVTEAVARKAEETRRPGRVWVFVSLGAALFLLAGAAWLWRSRTSAPPARGQKKEKNVAVRLTDHTAGDMNPSVTRDGRIRFLRRQGRQGLSFVMDGNGGNQHRDATIPGLGAGFWSPDGKRVLFYKESDDSHTLYLANADGTGETRLPFLSGNLDWTPDGTRILFQYGKPNSDIFLYTLATGKLETVVGGPAFDADPTFSPDGERIAYVSDREGNFEIYVQDLDGAGLRRLTDHPAHDQFPSFSPDGTAIAFNSNREGDSFDVYVMGADGGHVFRVTNWRGNEMVSPGCWSADGTRLVFVGDQDGRDSIYLVDIEPFTPREVLKDAAADLYYPSYSPDGGKILCQAGAADRSGELRIYDTTAKRGRSLLKTEAADAHPKFSPDGTRIVFQNLAGGQADIFLINPDGSGLRLLTDDPAPDKMPAFSPDGSRIVFGSGRDGNYALLQLYVMNSDGSNQHRVYYSRGLSLHPSWSPDGGEIVFANDKEDDRTGNFEIFAIAPETAEPERRLTFRRRWDVYPVFSPDGRHIAFASNADGNSEIYLMNADGSGLLRLTRDPAEDAQPSWAPDGRRVVFSSNRGGKFGIYELEVK
jgi:Tol biopolymer transport system component/DNA-binding winged helix-turn-helix (wHTH) protein